MKQLLDLPMKLSKTPRNAYDIHSMVYSAMLDDRETSQRDFLFTHLLDMGGMVLIRSANLPSNLHPYAIPVALPKKGERRLFELTACPMKKDTAGNKTRPLPKGDPAARIEWLKKIGERKGFELVHSCVTSRPVHYDRKGTKFWLERAQFWGDLIVTDADKMAQALADGFGRARSLGHGMMRWV